MSGDQFGYQLQELGKIQQDWQQLHERMNALTQQLGAIKGAIEKAAATDVFDSTFAGIVGFGVVVGEVVKDVKDIDARADRLKAVKEKLTSELADDAQKIQAVIDEYQAVERRLEDEWRKHQDDGSTTPKPPGSGNSGDGENGNSGEGHGHTGMPIHRPGHLGGHDGDSGDTGDAGGPGGKHDGQHLKDHSTGDWKTHFINGSTSWEDWPANSHTHLHPKNGEGKGILARPNLDGVSDERKAIVERALERVEHKLGYSQGAETNGYRVDCSGFVSCAWGLPGPGATTWGLMEPSVSHRISKDQLQPGDAMIMGDHTVLFGGWANAAHTEYMAIEDDGSDGCVSHVIPYPYYHGDTRYEPYRRNGVQ